MARRNVDLFYRITMSLNRDACMGSATRKRYGNERRRNRVESKSQVGHKLIPKQLLPRILAAGQRIIQSLFSLSGH